MIVALNNKCNLGKQEYLEYQKNLENVKANSKLILCTTALNIGQFSLNNYSLGAQNVGVESSGAHTGELAASHLKSYGVEYCIIGHSERRIDQKETNEDIRKKANNLFAEGIIPILCCGETKEEREQNRFKDVITEELTVGTKDLTASEKEKLIIAYEPIWSIGTGLIPTNEEIEEVFHLIKEMFPNTKVLYGGSANEKNIDELKKCSSIDGYLLGGLSLKPENLQVFINKLEN